MSSKSKSSQTGNETYFSSTTAKNMDELSDNEKFERLLEYVSSPQWHHPISTFMDRESVVFDMDEDKKNTTGETDGMETTVDAKESHHMVVFGSYRRLIDNLLLEGERESGFASANSSSKSGNDEKPAKNFDNSEANKRDLSAREMLLKLARQTPAAGQDIINVFHMYDSCKFFRQKMAERNVELQLEVLELIEQEHGQFPDDFFQPSSNHPPNAQQEENDLARAIELSKLEYEKELERQNSGSKLDVTTENDELFESQSKNAVILRTRRDQLLQQLVQHQNTINEEQEDNMETSTEQILKKVPSGQPQSDTSGSILFAKQNSVLQNSISDIAGDTNERSLTTFEGSEQTTPLKAKKSEASLLDVAYHDEPDKDQPNFPASSPIDQHHQRAALKSFEEKQNQAKLTNAIAGLTLHEAAEKTKNSDFDRRRQFLLQQREKLVAVRAAKRDAELLDLKQRQHPHPLIQGKPTKLSQASEAHQAHQ